jgi:hypothetical protein
MKPRTLEEFLRFPTRDEWVAELINGWAGPDGSSNSPDDLMGVRIGVTSRSYTHAHLPANLHDWRYRLGRRYRLPHAWKLAADAEYRDGCYARVRAALVGWRVRAAQLKAWGRYVALVAFGAPAWRDD